MRTFSRPLKLWCAVAAFVLAGVATSAAQGPALARREQAKADLDGLWNALQSPNPVEGKQAVKALAAVPRLAVPLLGDKLRPAHATKLDGEDIAKLLTDLDDPVYSVRQKATAVLQELGEPVVPTLRKYLETKPTLEVCHRLKLLIKVILESPLSPKQLQAVRAVEVLERIATPEACRILAALTEGLPQARLTVEAKEALERLGK